MNTGVELGDYASYQSGESVQLDGLADVIAAASATLVWIHFIVQSCQTLAHTQMRTNKTHVSHP